MSNPDKLVHTHRFNFNPNANAGEGLSLTTKMFHNGDKEPDGSPDPDGLYWVQELSLQSYSNVASFALRGEYITPKNLRKLADELEKAADEAVRYADTRASVG